MTEANLADKPAINDDYVLVESDQALNALCSTWQESGFLAMDTEFMRTSTFFPHVGLIQINAGAGNYLVDPLTISDWQGFRELMLNPGIVKIFHSCSEDLQVFMAEMQLVPHPVFDTQIAAGFLNDGFGYSYQNLVSDYLDIDLPKDETRSDWLQRPLHDKQCRYAALDVACLPAIYARQRQALLESDRLAWFEEECDSILALYREEMKGDFRQYYQNLRGAWQLDESQLGTLQKLAEWREWRARKRDKPRNWIVKDKELIEIARRAPRDMSALQDIAGLDKNFLRHEGPEVIKLVEQSAESPAIQRLQRPLEGKSKNRLKKGQRFAEARAAELDLPPEILIRKRWLISLLQNMLEAEKKGGALPDPESLLPPELTGWRRDLLLPGLFDAMEYKNG